MLSNCIDGKVYKRYEQVDSNFKCYTSNESINNNHNSVTNINKLDFDNIDNHITINGNDNCPIERARKNGYKTTKIKINNDWYDSNIAGMFQKNLKTGNRCSIRAVPGGHTSNNLNPNLGRFGNSSNNYNNNNYNYNSGNNQRNVQASASYMKWQWLTDDKKSWITFNKKDSISIENARQNGQHTTQIGMNNNNLK